MTLLESAACISCAGGERNRRIASGWSQCLTRPCSTGSAAAGTATTRTNGSTESWAATSTAWTQSSRRPGSGACHGRRPSTNCASCSTSTSGWRETTRAPSFGSASTPCACGLTMTRWTSPTTSSTRKPLLHHPTGSRTSCTTRGRCPPAPPSQARSSAMTYRSVPSGGPGPSPTPSSRSACPGIRLIRTGTWIWPAP